ncbi:MAG: GntR family transcriptional regulator [Clostridia bacterium]|nr:GntR family transcriptional regulator [Clostridia bacterium]
MSSSALFPAVAQNKPIREIAYDTLKHAIITGDIPAGARIVETEYASKMHISRTPLREALRKLERDGLVEYLVRRGVIVRVFSTEDIYQIYTIRNALELLTLPAAVQNVTDADITELRNELNAMDALLKKEDIEALAPLARAFHSHITRLSGLYRIIRAIDSQDEFITRFSAMAIRQENRRNDAQREHHIMVDLLEKRDLPGLHKLVEAHIEHSKQKCLEAFVSQNNKAAQ